MMIRSTPEKQAEQAKLANDVESFLANGGEIKTLPGFGMEPRITNVSALRFELNNTGKDNSLPDHIDQGIMNDLKSGMGTTQVARKWRVGTTTVTVRKDKLLAQQERL